MQQKRDFRSECQHEILVEMSIFGGVKEMPTEDKAAEGRAPESWLLADIMGTRPAGREVIKLHSTMASPLINFFKRSFTS